MTVSLVTLRFEIEDGFGMLTSLQYVAEQYFEYVNSLSHITKDLDRGRQDCLTPNSKREKLGGSLKNIPELHRGRRELRNFVIEIYQEMAESGPSTSSDRNIPSYADSVRVSKPQRSHSLERTTSESSDVPLALQFFSGNPSVEKTKGILHLFKDKHLTPLDEHTKRSELLCMLGVPAKYTCSDLQKFIAPARDSIQHIQIIRDSLPNQYMVLLKFYDQPAADIFYSEYNGKPYNMLESETVHLVYVAKVESIKASEGAFLPVSGLTELPTCPVCLERMDESVEGILTVLCNHSFHNDCLSKWTDTCCPVCRYCQTPEVETEQSCSECESKESLWICLICGHVGCGRYQSQHAYQHFKQTAHTFTMQLGNQRVWDYAGDNYVHRLIQGKGDGKLVSLKDDSPVQDEKMDSLTLEYTYLLTNQLESQRLHFEEKMDFLEQDAHEKIALTEERLMQTDIERKELEARYLESEKERKAIEKKYAQVVGKVGTIAKDLRDERQMNVCLRQNQIELQKKVDELEKHYDNLEAARMAQISELQSQVGDLMKHLEMQSAVENATQGVKEEIQAGQVFTESTEPTTKGSARQKIRSKKR